jgi:hypothetical protein
MHRSRGQVNFEFGYGLTYDPMIFDNVIPLELRKKIKNVQFPFFSSPELKAQVSYSDRPLSVVRLFVCLSVCLSVCL